MRFQLFKTTDAFSFLLIRMVVGLIFVSEGLQKFITPDTVGAGKNSIERRLYEKA